MRPSVRGQPVRSVTAVVYAAAPSDTTGVAGVAAFAFTVDSKNGGAHGSSQ